MQTEGKLIPESIIAREIKKASIKADNTKWFFTVVVLSFSLAFMAYYCVSLSRQAANNIKTIHTKTNIDGTWDVEYSDNKKPKAYPRAVVEKLLREYTKYRLSKDPATIKQFYGRAQHMMEDNLYQEFVSEKGYNAIKVIEELVACTKCMPIKVRPNKSFIYNDYKHFFGKKRGYKKVYQSNAYFHEYEEQPSGVVINKHRKIFNITWRIRSEKEQESFMQGIKKEEELLPILDINPIGLLVVSEEIINAEEDE